jgi:hypothetical protein
MTTLQAVITFLFVYRFPILVVSSLCQFVYLCRLRRKLKLYVRWYQSQQAQQSYYQPQQQYRQW